MKKYAIIPIALVLGFFLHFITSYNLYLSKTSSHAYFSTSMRVTFFYLILAVIGWAILVIVPIELGKKNQKTRKELINWWWQIYLSYWVLVVFVILECWILSLFSLTIGRVLVEYTLLFFIPKGFCLIPSYFMERNAHKKKIIFGLIFIEIMVVAIFVGMRWMAGQMVPDFR